MIYSSTTQFTSLLIKPSITKITKKRKKAQPVARKMVEDSRIDGGFKILKMSTTEKKEFHSMIDKIFPYYDNIKTNI